MPEPTDDIPDYLSDGSLNIHGKLAHKFRINKHVDRKGKINFTVQDDSPSEAQMMKQVNEEIDKAYNS